MTVLSIPARFDRAFLLAAADWLAVGVAAALPWSTSATGIFIALWFIAVLTTIDLSALRRVLLTPAGGLPVLLWAFALLGTLWAGPDVTWSQRFGGLEGYLRLLAIPLLLTQFARSDNGRLVIWGFLASEVCLLLTSWAFDLIPALQSHGNFRGVPVKDYIFQSDEFLVCSFALLGIAGEFAIRRQWQSALHAAIVSALFLTNLAFVFASRTSLLVLPFLIAALGWRLSGLKGAGIACLAATVLAPVIWFSSPHLRFFTLHSVSEMRSYFKTDAVTSSGMHLEFLRKSIGIVAHAPIIGHGTGSIPEEFRRAAAGESGAAAIATVNPHNQILAVAIELGSIGGIALLAMWCAHLWLFRGAGWTAWAGMVVVIENVVSSTLNSHLFDFSQGWLYVFGVGTAGGVVLRKLTQERPTVAGAET
ncbi:MAG: O-antigen ligase family protein [Xanthobacteraceae bacterium]